MSVTGISSNPNKIHKSSLHWRNDSEELDVFEAARYFSAATNDQNPTGGANNFLQKFIRDDHRQQNHARKSSARMSLDMPMIRNPIILPPEYHVMDQKPISAKEKKKYKQPSSPGGRLASFLNSLFNQTSLKKKKSKAGNNNSKDFEVDESPGGRRKRRSSISHFRITNTTKNNINNNNNNPVSVSASKSGFRTPPLYANTPTKSYREFRNLEPDLPKNRDNSRPTLLDELNAKKTGPDYSWIEEKIRASEQIPKHDNSRFSYRKSTTDCDDLYKSGDRDFRKFSDPDDGADSDSSSDLFDLPNHDLDFYSSSLPVYETTHMDRIKIGAPISRATTV